MKQTNLNLILGLQDRKTNNLFDIWMCSRENRTSLRLSEVQLARINDPLLDGVGLCYTCTASLKEKCVYRTSFNWRDWLRPWAKSRFQKREGVTVREPRSICSGTITAAARHNLKGLDARLSSFWGMLSSMSRWAAPQLTSQLKQQWCCTHTHTHVVWHVAESAECLPAAASCPPPPPHSAAG